MISVRALSRYGPGGASSRVRMMQYVAPLAALGVGVAVEPLLDDLYLARKYRGQPVTRQIARSYLRRLRRLALTPRRAAQVTWIEKELWPWVPAAIERGLWGRTPVALDYDDAIFHTYDRHPSAAARRMFGDKIDSLMRHAALVIAGNRYLAERAEAAGAAWVEVLPTVVDAERYALAADRRARVADADAATDEGDAPAHRLRPLVVGWIGSPATVKYLQALGAPLAALAARRPLVLRVIGAQCQMPGVQVETRPWTEATEAAELAATDIGVMPLPDTPWERGKCGYKLIQSMACGVPVVASPVGANREIVRDGVDGLLAADERGWFEALDALAGDAERRRRMGAAGRARVAERYSLAVAAPRLASWLTELASRRGSRRG